jgi:hypothetical protein
MTYRMGIGPRLAWSLGEPGSGPCLICDTCGAKANGMTKRGHYADWLLKGKPPRGWVLKETTLGAGKDSCAKCSTMKAST